MSLHSITTLCDNNAAHAYHPADHTGARQALGVHNGVAHARDGVDKEQRLGDATGHTHADRAPEYDISHGHGLEIRVSSSTAVRMASSVRSANPCFGALLAWGSWLSSGIRVPAAKALRPWIMVQARNLRYSTAALTANILTSVKPDMVAK
ncbi:hypothetical protein GQ600_3400 [Phytophthora cactorum]|nr:hypothetical protein GQ600_3400 [Phytophthora cactorum]